MIPELGHFALIIGLVLSGVQGSLPLLGASLGGNRWIDLAKPVARAQWLFMAVSFACLTYAFISNDFSVRYVASNSNTQLPLIYRISAVWGAHEGSLLLWAFILSSWGAAVTIFSKSIPPVVLARVISVMGLISVGFMSFMIFTSNPFERLFPVPAEG
ncbi:MAG: c-type cytochrome biogenesis protein CcmF, partial [Gammaproteobacteria bacterium]|nr:c-type cytochrome biogenesis protein CcmF [Gammaproteobacteria bacterium]